MFVFVDDYKPREDESDLFFLVTSLYSLLQITPFLMLTSVVQVDAFVVSASSVPSGSHFTALHALQQFFVSTNGIENQGRRSHTCIA